NVNGMAQDRAGYLWVATTDGLARYDGVGVRVWRHVPGDPAALPGNYIAAVHVDGKDRVWVAIEGRGLSVLDAGRESFRHYRKATHPRIGSDDTWAIASHDGAVWFGTFGGGLHRLDDAGDGREGRITGLMPKDGDPRSLPSDTVLSLSVDARQRLWVGTTQGLARWTGRDFERIALPGDTPAPTIYSITPEGDAVWVGAKSGLYRYGADGRWTRPAWSSMFAWPNAVFGIVPDRGGHWLASHRNLWRVAPGAMPYPVPIGEHGPVRPMYQMLKQANGAMWFPVSGAGLGYLRPDWRRIAEFSREQGGLGSDLVRGVAPAAHGGVWLAGHRGEIERLDPDGTRFAMPRRVQTRMEGRRPIAVVEDGEGRVWLGERSALLRIDRAGGVREWPADAASDAPPGGPIDLMRVAPDGTLWLSSSGAGIQQRDAGSGRVLTRIQTGAGQGLGVGDIEAIEFAADGALWVAGDTGLARWDPRAGRLQPVAGIAAGDRVFGFAFDGADALWLQRLSGLEHYQRCGSRWRLHGRAGVADGIPAVEGSGLRVDSRHRVWLASLRGLFRWDPQRRHVRRFDLQDGLSSQEFSDHAMTLTEAGVLVAALADGGVVLIDTLADDPPASRPGLFWDRVQVRRAGQWQALAIAAPVLGTNDRELRVQLRLLAYESPSANRYFTRLDGYDAHWVAQGDSGERVFAGLAPGDYTLRARAVDAAGNPAREQVLRFHVQPPWWRTPWALAGFVGLAMLLLWSVADAYRQRLKRRLAWRRAQHEREVASDASLAKTRFLATLGHEVRTPMTGVLGMSELLLGTALDTQQRGYTESIHAAGVHLLRLMNDALDLARIESGKLQLDDEAFDLHALVADVVALMGPLARRRGLHFRVDVAAGLPTGLRGDASRVRQILLNLLGNAIKFTEHGEVAFRVSAATAPRMPAGEASRDGAFGEGACYDGIHFAGIQFEISDTGPGLNVEQQARLFRRFEQAEGACTAARYGGSGLGLAICQELAAAMHGTIEVDSTPGVGTRFSVRLPLPQAELAARARAAVRPVSDGLCECRSVLLVEDDATVAAVVTGLLHAQGHHVVHAAQGLAALTEVATASFDLALLDLDLPGMDGFALARQLRAQGFDAPLIALTARADADAEPLSMAAGFDRFLRKPVTGAMLAELLQGCGEPVG
ncbi:MAG: hybrid sensor histidine kinase/response regulator, partial [Lysobacter sp.]